jgi:hypothetical protein
MCVIPAQRPETTGTRLLPDILFGARARRAVLVCLLVGMSLVGTMGARGAAVQGRPSFTLALSALVRLDADYYDSHSGLYVVTGEKHGPYAALWPTSQALAGAIAVARHTGANADKSRVRHIIAALGHYGSASHGFRVGVSLTRRYYDDNNWICLDLLNAYDLLHAPDLLVEAEQLFSFLITGWDTRHGGMVWADDKGDKPTVSTAPAIAIAARLAKLTGSRTDAAWAKRMFAWENAALRDPSGLYWDHIRATGGIDKDIVSYNQGVMIEAYLWLWRLTGSTAYRDGAVQLASLAGRALGGPRQNTGTYAAFDAIYFAALADLRGVSPRSVSLDQARQYIIWARNAALAPRVAQQRSESGLLGEAAFVLAAASAGM